LPEPWFELSEKDRGEALELASFKTGRPPHLLEKDIWVVWLLSEIYGSSLGKKLTFKGGTSLSKVYKIIDRFSEDIDLTYDIRELVPDMLNEGNPLPESASQEKKITKMIRKRLPEWIKNNVKPVIENALLKNGVQAKLLDGASSSEKIIIEYQALKKGTGYAPAKIQLEFGARATGEPHESLYVQCDIAPLIDGIKFPEATPMVMNAERTFWEKATAAHVYSLQERMRGNRYSRHWYDLAAMAKTGHASRAAQDHTLAKSVANHKSVFFAEKDVKGIKIDYRKAVNGGLRLIPSGSALAVLEADYMAMLEDGLLALHQPSFNEIMHICQSIQEEVNKKTSDGSINKN